jgi:serine/threonine protein kinase
MGRSGRTKRGSSKVARSKKKRPIDVERSYQRYRKRKGLGDQFPMLATPAENIVRAQELVEKAVGEQGILHMKGILYKKEGIVGKGAFGEVWDCILPALTSQRDDRVEIEYVAKRISLQIPDVSDNVWKRKEFHRLLLQFVQEVKALMLFVNDPEVVRAVGGFIKKKRSHVTCCIVMEKSAMTLEEYMAQANYSVAEGAKMCMSLVKVAEFTANKMGFVHGDLHSGNILCDANGEHLKICDFGLAQAYGGDKDTVPAPPTNSVEDHRRNTEAWHISKRHRTRQADGACDHYSLGVMMLKLLCGNSNPVPFYFISYDVFLHPFPPGGYMLPDGTKDFLTETEEKIQQVVAPVLSLLKTCLVDGKVLPTVQLFDVLKALSSSEEARELWVWYCRTKPNGAFETVNEEFENE